MTYDDLVEVLTNRQTDLQIQMWTEQGIWSDPKRRMKDRMIASVKYNRLNERKKELSWIIDIVATQAVANETAESIRKSIIKHIQDADEPNPYKDDGEEK